MRESFAASLLRLMRDQVDMITRIRDDIYKSIHARVPPFLFIEYVDRAPAGDKYLSILLDQGYLLDECIREWAKKGNNPQKAQPLNPVPVSLEMKVS